MLDRILFVLGEALQALRRNRWMTFATITNAAMAMFLLGGLTVLYIRLQNYAGELSKRVELRVFLNDNLTEAQMHEVGTKVKAIPHVTDAIWISKADSWSAFKSRYPQSMVSAIENPLPNMFKVKTDTVAAIREVAAKVEKIQGVEPGGVKYRSDAQEFVTATLQRIRIIGSVVGLMMLLTSAILIYNTIRLTVVARHREIRIMRMVGASRATVIMPMVIEGVLQGALGGVLGALMIFAVHQAYANFVGPDVARQMEAFSLASWALNLGVIGAVFGTMCSVFALRDVRRAR